MRRVNEQGAQRARTTHNLGLGALLAVGALFLPAPGNGEAAGHSAGGFHVRAFAGLYPRATAGLVLVDATHELFYRRLDELEEGALRSTLERLDARNREGKPEAVLSEYQGFRKTVASGALAAPAPDPDLVAEAIRFVLAAEATR